MHYFQTNHDTPKLPFVLGLFTVLTPTMIEQERTPKHQNLSFLKYLRTH
jgi:hypothetical protein